MKSPDANVAIWIPPLVLVWAYLVYLFLFALTHRFPRKCKLITRLGFFHLSGGYLAGTIIEVLTNHLDVSSVAHFVLALLVLGMVWIYPLAVALISILLFSPETWRSYWEIQKTYGYATPSLSTPPESQPHLGLHPKTAKF